MSTSLVFFGTGPVALKSLRHLSQNFEIESVITRPDKRLGKQARSELSVEAWAHQQKIPVHLPASSHELNDVSERVRFKSRFGVVIDYGIIISQSVIASFPLGIINSHFSLLPEWRGADPITFAILSGQDRTGVSLMQIVPELDCGPLIAQKDLSIQPDATTPSLTQELIELSNELLDTYLPLYGAGKVTPYPQPTQPPATYSRKITKQDGSIDWHQSAQDIERSVRAFIGWPGSQTTLHEKTIILTDTAVYAGEGLPGVPYQLGDGRLAFGTGKDILAVNKLKPAGRNEMLSADFLRGARLSIPKLKLQ